MRPTFLALPRLALAASALAVIAATSLSADDRELLARSIAKPYVFVLLDTSGSMNWSPPCSAADFGAGRCNYLCPSGDCPVPRDGDDPASKFRQAKEALFEVFKGTSEIDFGFATFNQDQMRVQDKHWLYRPRTGQLTHSILGGMTWPLLGEAGDEVFGATLTCDRNGGGDGGGSSDVACYGTNPADIDAAGAATEIQYWERKKAQRLPKLGRSGSSTVTTYIRTGNSSSQRYRVRHSPSGAVTLGSPSISVNVEVARCTNGDCTSTTGLQTLTIVYDLVGPFVMWDFQVSRTPDSGGWFGYQDNSATNFCNGWDPNSDSGSDSYSGYSLRFPNTGGTSPRDYGDRIPLDWAQDNRQEIMSRLAPIRRAMPSPVAGDPDDPDASFADAFTSAGYLANTRAGADTFLRLSDDALRPLFPLGATPLGASTQNFRSWYCNNSSGDTCPGGFNAAATAQDPQWGCRAKYLLVLTDGDETCDGDPCAVTRGLWNGGNSAAKLRTYVVAFGVDSTTLNPGNKLICMAADGGTTRPIFPQNKQELVDALNNVFREIKERSSTFASAAVPSVQATTADKIFVSSFTPVDRSSVWAGQLLAFLKPLPIDPNTKAPDTSVRCSSLPADQQSKCYLWDAGDLQVLPSYAPQGLLLQAPDAGEITSGVLRLGEGVDERRLLYNHRPTADQAGKLRLFAPPAPGSPYSADEFWLWKGLDPAAVPSAANAAALRLDAQAVIEFTVKEKQADVTNPLTGTTRTIKYLMGDIFHSDPVVVESPSNALYYSKNLYADPNLCGPGSNRTGALGYRAFAQLHACRRKMLMVGANDGQFHAFDGGTWTLAECRADTTNVGFSNGTGRELFAFMPREVLPTVRAAATATSQEWSLDGRTRIVDIYLDPLHNGTPTCLEREWRTVALGSLREGGRSYFALDVTQPDTYQPFTAATGYVPNRGGGDYLTTCTDLDANGYPVPVPGCGPLPFPALLWEFTDSWDEDNQGAIGGDRTWASDLAETWSQVTTGRIRVRVCGAGCSDASPVEDRFVAVFGGGVGDRPTRVSGNWLYMVDIETGRAIYKRPLAGPAPASASAVDTNNDGYLDTIYLGTLAGFLYKVDLGLPTTPLDLVDTTTCDYNQDPDGIGPLLCTTRNVQRIVSASTRPYQVFSTGGRPIYMEVSVLYVQKLQRYALAFGTGNRWDLWNQTGPDSVRGRFYLFLDTGFVDSNRDGVADGGVLTESSYQAIDPDLAYSALTPDYLFDTADLTPGWYLDLAATERVITDPFAISGVVAFTAYNPGTQFNPDGTCSRVGSSRIFIVKATNASPYVFPDPNNPNDRDRYLSVGDFTTQPFVEQSVTKNPGASRDTGETADRLCTAASMARMREELKTLFPTACRFANWNIDVKTIRSDTGLVCVAPVPQCVIPQSFKEW